MSSVKEYVKFIGQDVNINFALSANDDFLGYQQEINNLVQITGSELINPVIDVETRRFRYSNPSGQAGNVNFFFGDAHVPNFYFAGFKLSDITPINPKILNSFFILDFYDTFSAYTQTKIFSTYMTKIGTSALYTIDTNNQFYYLQIPKYFIDLHTYSAITAYVKFSFYSANDGKLAVFENNNVTDAYTQEKMYFKVFLNTTDRTWRFYNNPANAFQVTGQYATKINDAITNFDNKQQVYPLGNTFQTAGGNYTTV